MSEADFEVRVGGLACRCSQFVSLSCDVLIPGSSVLKWQMVSRAECGDLEAAAVLPRPLCSAGPSPERKQPGQGSIPGRWNFCVRGLCCHTNIGWGHEVWQKSGGGCDILSGFHNVNI
jgi:hypothetical protein